MATAARRLRLESLFVAPELEAREGGEIMCETKEARSVVGLMSACLSCFDDEMAWTISGVRRGKNEDGRMKGSEGSG